MNGELTFEDAKREALAYVRETLLAESKNEPALLESETVEKPWGWVFFWNTRLFTETGDLVHAVFGPDPVCVSRSDGRVTSVSGERPLQRELRRYERKSGFRPWWRLWA